MCNKCFKVLNEFIDIELNDDIQRLITYDFTEYGKKMKRDCDRTPVVNAIYCVLYRDYFKSSTCLLKSNPFSKTCGDTLNTYNSSFGNGHAGIKSMRLIQEYGDDQIEELLKFFKIRYHSIGNFMPLPMKTMDRVSLNTGRNTAFNDYFDLFLMLVEDYYTLGAGAFIAKYEDDSIRKSINRLHI